jgi:enoyl-CoA hydratase/carnithine racemase
LEANNEVKVITILSNVPKSFCAGADIKEFAKDRAYSSWLANDIFREYYNTFRNGFSI